MIIENYYEFVTKSLENDYFPSKKRLQELAGIKPISTYLIEITFEVDNQLLEYIDIKKFKKTTNRYRKDSEQINPPVKAHYHIFSNNGNKEIYAVNTDGTAHHQKHKGKSIPKKEADELRKLGAEINKNNIIEVHIVTDINKSKLLTESLEKDCISLFFEVEDESA